MPYNPITAIPRVTTAPLETTGIKLASGRRRRPVVKFERFDLDIFLFLTQCVRRSIASLYTYCHAFVSGLLDVMAIKDVGFSGR
jgi:hypothetical protein